MGIYLNNASTTKPDEQVLKDFMYCAEKHWHNPSDVSQDAIEAKDIIKKAQKQIADVINANPDEIIFTSGGSESNNWAIKGFLDKNPEYKTIITTKIEHDSVYRTCQYMENHGCKVYYAPIDHYGQVKLNVGGLEALINNNRISKPFVSIMLANNEIGTIQPIKKIAEIVHKHDGILHVDAVQAFMHQNIDVEDLGIDMMSASFHKFGGFKNCGFLYIKDGINLSPLIHGGHQFNSKRAGTENVPMIYAMGNQVERINEDLFVIRERIEELYHYLVNQIYSNEDISNEVEVWLNGHPQTNWRMCNNISFTFNGIKASNLITLLELKGVYVSAGSACNSGDTVPSRVLKAIGLKNEEAFSTIRISINEKTTMEDIDIFVDALVECIKSLQMFS